MNKPTKPKKPSKPYILKPEKPEKEIFDSDQNEFLMDDEDFEDTSIKTISISDEIDLEINATVSWSRYDECYYPVLSLKKICKKKIPNPFYEIELEKYEILLEKEKQALALYEKEMQRYEKERLQYQEDMIKYGLFVQETKKKEKEKIERELYEKLKKKFDKSK